jgi:hypothetical protein
MTAWVVAPTEAKSAIYEQLKEDFEVNIDDDNTRRLVPRVKVFDFDEMQQKARDGLGDDIEAILLCCPPTQTNLYFQIVRACCERSSPLQLHLFHSDGFETVEDAQKIFLQ